MFDMMMPTVGFVGAAIVVLGTGVWLTCSGRPFNTVLLAVHKLVALAVVAILGVLAYRAADAALLSTADWILVISAGLLCLASFASGGVVSATEAAPAWVLWVHRIGTWFAAGAVGLCLVRLV